MLAVALIGARYLKSVSAEAGTGGSSPHRGIIQSEEASLESFHQTADFMREYLRTLIGAIESLRTGATTVVDEAPPGASPDRRHARSRPDLGARRQ